MTIILPKRQRLDLSADPDAVNFNSNFEDVDRNVGLYDQDNEDVYHDMDKVKGGNIL